jgi:protein-tyrosine phosphatase
VNEDAGSKFHRAIDFLSRVFQCKGKVYVHCTMGASRAPTMVMAYLIAKRKISLLDSLRYLQALRSVIQPNAHFLFQLAQLEVPPPPLPPHLLF